MIHADNEPLTNRMLKIESELRSLTDGVHGLRTSVDQNTGRHQLLSDRIIALETKVDVFWKNVALDVARVLHSPNPARAHVDELLEAFMEGRISHTERDELKDLLVYIRDYHPGDPSDFPVYPGDQVAAAILLQTIDLVGGPVHR